MVTKESDHIKINGHIGKWYVINDGYFIPDTEIEKDIIGTKHLFLLEHETYGDEAACLIVDEDGIIYCEDVWNGFDDIIEQGWEGTNLGGDIDE